MVVDNKYDKKVDQHPYPLGKIVIVSDYTSSWEYPISCERLSWEFKRCELYYIGRL